MNKPIWINSTPEHKSILITLLMMANFHNSEWEWGGEKFNVDPGQFVTSLDSIKQNCGKGVSIQNIRSALSRFEKLEFLTNKATKTGRVITICNWKDYQEIEDTANKDSNKEVTKEQQRGNKGVTPNKNDNNDNKDNKDKNIYIEKGHLSITWDEFNKLADKFGEEVADDAVNRVLNYRKNSKYKSLYLTSLLWLKRDKEKAEESNGKPKLAI